MIHDIRTPLSIIQSLAQWMTLRVEEPSMQEFAAEISAMDWNARLISRILNNISDMENIDAGRLRMHMELLEAVSWLRELSRGSIYYARCRGIELTFATDLETLWLLCDGVRLERCVLNLVTNSLNFTGYGGLICLTVTVCGDEGCISVSDNGCGMGKEQVADLLRSEREQKPDAQAGGGLGLRLVKRFLEHMGGRIEIDSEPGEGTCVRLFLRAQENGEP
jgi:signal transduction histidine kinase